MTGHSHQSGFRTVVLAILAITLLLLLVLPHASNLTPCLILLAVFVFGIPEQKQARLPVVSHHRQRLSPVHRTRFQRPPPSV
ncbi:hypothetical protein AB4Y89_23460 [Terriglobus sp. 2YAB30_2]|uniref:hypothetical protein n=1 Tax=unclassified Terriglobus TaxID=2628988 RepID=UPI003F9D2248